MKYDVIIIGGGVSGCHAAIAAGRNGAKTLLIEQFNCLGGSLTIMGVGPMMSFHNRSGEQLIYGTPQEMVDRLIKRGGSPGHIIDSTGYCSTVTPFDAELLKVVLEEMVIESGVDVLFHTRLIGAHVENSEIVSVEIHNRGGKQIVSAACYIDASSDGELVRLANIPFVLGREQDNKTQPLTMNVKVGNVDREALINYIKGNWKEFNDDIRNPDAEKVLDRTSRISMWGFYSLWNEAKLKGEVTIPRDNLLFFETNNIGEFIFNTSRILNIDPTNPFDISRAEIEGRRQGIEIFNFLKKYVPGFEKAIYLSTPMHIGVRESRHTKASYVLSAEDLVNENKFLHPVAVGGYPIDIHSPEGGDTNSVHFRDNGNYSIPMESLLTDELHNLVLSGRLIGADHYASAAIRVTPIAMSIGQASGTIAALSVKNKCMPFELDYLTLKQLLEENKVKL